MSHIVFKDKINQVNNNRSLRQMMKSEQQQQKQIKLKNNRKADDYVFKRYKYQPNHLIHNDGQGRVKHDQYDSGNNKENQLEKYKKQLEEQEDHFGIVDFGNDDQEQDIDDIQNQQVKQVENNNNITKKTQSSTTQKTNIFQQQQQYQFSQQLATKQKDEELNNIKTVKKKYNNTSNEKQQQVIQLAQGDQTINGRYTAQFDIKPMQLVDFDDDDQEEQQDQYKQQKQQQQENHQISFDQQYYDNNTTIRKNNNNLTLTSNQSLNLSHDNNKLSQQHLVSPTKKKTIKSVFFSQSTSNHQNYNRNKQHQQKTQQQSHQNTFKKQHPKARTKNSNRNSNQYQIHNLSSTDNPYKDAIDYSQQYQQSSQQQLKGVKITKLPNNQNIEVQIIDKDLFVSSKIPPGIILKCKLKRSSGFMSLMNPQYDLYLQNGLKHLVSAKKNVFRNRQLFYLSTQVSSYQKPIRTLMANVLHSTYWLVDQPKVIERKKISYLDILIDYKPFVQNYSRQMTILCPPTLKTYHIGLQYDIPCIDFYWFQKNITLQLHYRYKLLNQHKSSQKNFQLIDSQDQDQQQRQKYTKSQQKANKHLNNNNHKNTIQQTSQGLKKKKKIEENKDKYEYLKMTKTSQNIFDIQIQHPLTPLQAMAIVLTRFDAQLK